jgi:hypothetical protein
VQATDSGGNASPMSVQVSITTLPLPNTPTGLVATATAATKIVLTWTDTVPPKGLPILNYQVYCGLAPGSLTKIAMASGGSYTYTGLTPGTMYYCAVLASDTAGDLSPTSAPASAMTAAMPATPTSVIGTANASTNVTVAWTENVAAGGLPIASYQIYRGSSPSNLVKLASRTTTSYVDTAVSAQTTYFYAVQATDTAGDISLMSTTSQVVVPLAEKLLNGRLPWVLAPSKPGAP